MDISTSGYFDNFDIKKNYRKLIFIAGRPLQSAELNEVQDIILNMLSTVAGYLVSSGTILSGGSVSALSEKSITINDGVVMLNGYPVRVPSNTLTLDPTGINIVGVAYSENLITGHQDSSLLEPDPSSPNYLGDGAYREQCIGSWSLSTAVSASQSFFPVLTIQNGVILSSQSTTDDTSAISQAISKYDAGVHGSYVVNGLTVQYNSTNTDGSFSMNLLSGVARVNGTQKTISVETNFILDPISDTQSVSSEPVVFVTGTTKYPLRNNPVKDIISVSGTKVTTDTVTRGSSSGGADVLSNTPVLSIVSVTQGTTTYVAGTDFKQTGDTIDWSLSGAEPSPGSTYTVKYNYIDTFAATTDNKQIILANSDAANLVDSTTLYVTYEFYLTRIDRVVMSDTNGLSIIKGMAAISSLAQPPIISGAGYLSLAVVTLNYGVAPVIDSSSTTIMVPFSTMQAMENRLNDMEYNVAQLSLKDTASSLDPVTTKRGIIVDSLINTNMVDAGVAQTAVVDTDNHELKIPSNFSNSNIATSGGMLPIVSDSVAMSQIYQTKSRTINPFAESKVAIQASMQLSPYSFDSGSFWPNFHGRFLPRPTTVNVNLSGFADGETIDVSFRGSVVGSVSANSSGNAFLTITIPENTPNGSYKITAVGKMTNSTANSVFTLYGGGDIDWDPAFGEVYWGWDPIAQTFSMNSDTTISAISVFITELPTNTLVIKLYPTIAGMPDNSNLLALGSIPASSVVKGWNKISFKAPVRVTANTYYALVVATANVDGSVATAQVGHYDTTNATWITNQVNTGVLLISANENTWTPVQDEDLTFKIHTPVFSHSATIKVASNVTFSNNDTDFKLIALVNQVSGTSARWYFKVGGASYELPVNEVTYVNPIPSTSGKMDLYVDLSTTDTTVSPIFAPGVMLLTGKPTTPANYQMRAFNIMNGVSKPATIKVIIDQYAPSGTTITVNIKDSDSAWKSLTQKESVAIGNGFYTTTYEIDSVAANSSALQLLLATSNYQVRPLVKNIRLLII